MFQKIEKLYILLFYSDCITKLIKTDVL